MNRIAKYLKDEDGDSQRQTGKSLLQYPAGSVSHCSFCGREVKGSQFSAFAMQGQPSSAICKKCILAFSVQARFTDSEIFGLIYNDEPDYSQLAEMLRRRMIGEVGTFGLKKLVRDLVIRLVQRASSQASGCVFETCPKTGVRLEIPRLCLVTKEADAFIELMQIACREVGIVARYAPLSEIATGDAYSNMVDENCNGEGSWAENAILLCKGHAPMSKRTGIVYILDPGSDNNWPISLPKENLEFLRY